MKNKFKVVGINQRDKYEELILLHIPNPESPRFDELPSEILSKGDDYFVTFTPVKEEEVPEFNK